MDTSNPNCDAWLRTAHLPDGAVQHSHGWRHMTNLRAYLSEKILLALVTTNAMASAMSEDGKPMNPQQLAKFACDVANAMREEHESRDWLIAIPEQEYATALRPGAKAVL